MQHNPDAHLRAVDEDAVFALTRPDRRLLPLYFIYSLAANVAFPFVFLPLYFRYITLRYRFDKEGVAREIWAEARKLRESLARSH